MKPIIKLEHVSKIYHTTGEELYALNDVNMEIGDNAFASILGPSGSGKSTMLHILGLLDEPTRGKVFIGGIETNKLDEKKRAYVRGKKIGFIFQTFNLIPTLTVLENVALPALLYETDKERAERSAYDILERIGMKERTMHYPNQLSGGQRQRVAIARSLVNNPDILLADEPTGNLDSKTGEAVLEIFEELHAQGKTVIIITHDTDIAQMTDRTIHIKDGKIIEVET